MTMYDGRIIITNPKLHYLIIDRDFFKRNLTKEFDREIFICVSHKDLVPKTIVVPEIVTDILDDEFSFNRPKTLPSVNAVEKIKYEEVLLWMTGSLYIGTKDITPMGNEVFNNFQHVRDLVARKYLEYKYYIETFETVNELQKYVDKLRMSIELSQ